MEAHTYIVGASGSGKTTEILSEAPERGFAFLDKHGEAARRLADSRECIYWRPADLSFPVGFNPLENAPPDDRWKVTAAIVSIFSDIWGLGPETPRLLYYLRASVRLLLDTPGTTLLDIRRVLSDEKYRARLLKKCTDRETRQTWDEFDGKDAKQQAQEIGSLQNKVAALADPLPLRYIFGQPTSTLSIAQIITRGMPLILDLSDIGDEPAAILGAVIINAFKQAADAVGIPERPYRLYIDEFQNFGTSIIATILSESRKRGLFLTLAHQFISQLDEEIRDAVLGNCSTIMSFRIGANDAPIIASAIDWHAEDLMSLAVGRARMRTIYRGRPTVAQLVEVELPDLATGWLDRNIAVTQSRYARTREKVEYDLNKPARQEWARKKRKEKPSDGASASY
ncbi:conserved protein of unknown function; putative P-loop containing nucleoside triphosphate hydrolases [Bradyrhizobium sp. ORS 285]|uniref:type IV secretory system conjugative DNA transfer family protein n=1 Tax=Bradyrhizobium sp. ORS 285 TaxID=115808 RepID=UPI00024095A9|nr:TraM recognition domain-containing protein [Bradyrhizobium sp. ORS 285]CCD89869.1 conserved hypothetical protein; putative P-loop containing nucleoside triphosphate hydrolases [Bradyrhizobium sp. ORS 285]SMX61506.1 conserved protein of unknown function; putative P-loop containing nucleoside triphosphate hydrolases [Bradyrhizobium sp. ORS 285]